MYTIVDIAFAAMILMIGAILIVYLLVGGTTINTAVVTGVRDCVYAQIGNNMIPFLLKEEKYNYIEKIVQSCGASSVIIYRITSGNYKTLVYPQEENIKHILSKCSRVITIFVPIKEKIENSLTTVTYELIICIK